MGKNFRITSENQEHVSDWRCRVCFTPNPLVTGVCRFDDSGEYSYLQKNSDDNKATGPFPLVAARGQIVRTVLVVDNKRVLRIELSEEQVPRDLHLSVVCSPRYGCPDLIYHTVTVII